MELTKINRWAVTGTPLSTMISCRTYFIEFEPFMPSSRGAFVI